MYEEGEADSARHLELDSAEEIKCNVLLQSAATYKESVVTMIGTFNDAILLLETWFFDKSRMKPGYTSLTHDGRGSSSCTRLQDQGRITYSTLMVRSFLIRGISSIYAVFILSQPIHLLSAPGDQISSTTPVY
jgi:hypothetical protein